MEAIENRLCDRFVRLNVIFHFLKEMSKKAFST